MHSIQEAEVNRKGANAKLIRPRSLREAFKFDVIEADRRGIPVKVLGPDSGINPKTIHNNANLNHPFFKLAAVKISRFENAAQSYHLVRHITRECGYGIFKIPTKPAKNLFTSSIEYSTASSEFLKRLHMFYFSGQSMRKVILEGIAHDAEDLIARLTEIRAAAEMLSKSKKITVRNGAVVTRRPHKSDIAGSSPASATN